MQILKCFIDYLIIFAKYTEKKYFKNSVALKVDPAEDLF